MNKVLFTLFLIVILSSVKSWSQNCPQSPSQIPNFSAACVQVNTNNLNLSAFNDGVYSEGEIFRYTNAVTSPFNINAYIKIEKVKKERLLYLDRLKHSYVPQQNLYEGNNMITVNLSKLKTGVYTLQSINGNDIISSKFSVIR